MKYLWTFLTLVILSAAPSVLAQSTFYIRDTGVEPTSCTCGSCNICQNWTTACKRLPTTLCRGSTYYIADGTYPSYDFDDAGTGTITIKKAVSAPYDHGTEVGWNGTTMGSGQAMFGDFSFATGNYVIDGQIGAGALNLADRSYGIHVHSDDIVISTASSSVSNVTFKHVEISGHGDDGPDTTWPPNKGMYLASGTYSNWNFSQCYMHDFGNMVAQWVSLSDSKVEKNYIARNESSEPGHAEGIYGFGSRNTIAGNYFEDIEGTGVVMISGNNWKVYNNIIVATSRSQYDGTGNGAIADWSPDGQASSANNNLIYNNTFYNLKGNARIVFGSCGSSGCNSSSGNAAFNNLFYNCSSSGVSDSKGTSGNNITATANPFENIASQNFQIIAGSAPHNSGSSLAAEFATDFLGITRPQGSAWDAGAYERPSTTGNTPPSAPQNLTIR